MRFSNRSEAIEIIYLLKDMKMIEETAEFVEIMTIEEAHTRYGRL